MLAFEKQIILSTRSGTQQEMISNEANNDLYKYYLETDHRTSDNYSHIVLGNYDDLEWSKSAKSLTSQKVRRIGIKTFPQIGAIGFFTLLYEEKSKILAPVHAKVKKYPAPTMAIQETDKTLHITITPPQNVSEDETIENNAKVNYLCYRIILRWERFALEYVTYENYIEISKPITTGTYDIYCVGYIHEGEAISEDSNHIELLINGTQDTWPGPQENSDIFVKSVELTEDYKVKLTRSDRVEKVTQDVIPVPISATFTSTGKLQLTLSDGNTIITNNTSPGGGGGGSDSVRHLTGRAWEESSATVISKTIDTVEDALLVAILVHRADLTQYTEGWTMLCDLSGQFTGVTYDQKVAVFYKRAETLSEDFSATQATASRFYLNMHQFKNAGIPELTVGVQTTTDVQSNPLKIKKPSSNMVLWAVHAALYASSGFPIWTTTPATVSITQLGATTQSRLATIVDSEEPVEYTINNIKLDGSAGSSVEAAVIGIEIPSPSTAPINLCDNVAYSMWISGTTIYCNDTDYPNCKSFVIPITPGLVYRIRSTAIGDRERMLTCQTDPSTETTDTTISGIRLLKDTTSPVLGEQTVVTAESNENYLVIFHTYTTTESVSYEVYEMH